MASVSVHGWFVLVDGNGLLHFPLKVTVFFHWYFHISQSVLVACGGGVLCDGRVGMFAIGVFLNLTPSVLAISPMYSFSHPPHFTLYTTPHCFSFQVLSLVLTNRDLRVLKGLWCEGTPWDLNTL